MQVYSSANSVLNEVCTTTLILFSTFYQLATWPNPFISSPPPFPTTSSPTLEHQQATDDVESIYYLNAVSVIADIRREKQNKKYSYILK